MVAADLVNQDEFGLNRVGGGWLRQYREKVNIEDPDDPPNLIPNPSLQEVDLDTGFPVLVRFTAQGITIVSHPDFVTHGHTPGVGAPTIPSCRHQLQRKFPSGLLAVPLVGTHSARKSLG